MKLQSWLPLLWGGGRGGGWVGAGGALRWQAWAQGFAGYVAGWGTSWEVLLMGCQEPCGNVEV